MCSIRAAVCLWLDGERQKEEEYKYVELRDTEITFSKYSTVRNL